MDNVLGIIKMLDAPKTLNVFGCELPLGAARGAMLGADAVKQHVVFLSDTHITETRWRHFFDEIPNDSHKAAVFSSGAEDCFETLTGGVDSNMWVFVQRKFVRDGQTFYEHLVGRYGSAFDKVASKSPDGEQLMAKYQTVWDVKKARPVGLEGVNIPINYLTEASPFAHDSKEKQFQNINAMFVMLSEKAKGADDWFAMVMGPIAELDDGTKVMTQKGEGDARTLAMYNPNPDRQEDFDLHKLYAMSYLPPSCDLAEDEAVQDLTLVVEDREVDMSQNLWDAAGNGAVSPVIDVKLKDGTVVAQLQMRTVPLGSAYRRSTAHTSESALPQIVSASAGTLVAMSGSGRFLSSNPMDFDAGNLFETNVWGANTLRDMRSKVTEGKSSAGTLKNKLNKMIDPDHYNPSHNFVLGGRRGPRGGGPRMYDPRISLERLEVLAKAINKGDGGKQYAYKLLGSDTLTLVKLLPEADWIIRGALNVSKDKLMPTPAVKELIGAILGAQIYYRFNQQMEALGVAATYVPKPVATPRKKQLAAKAAKAAAAAASDSDSESDSESARPSNAAGKRRAATSTGAGSSTDTPRKRPRREVKSPSTLRSVADARIIQKERARKAKATAKKKAKAKAMKDLAKAITNVEAEVGKAEAILDDEEAATPAETMAALKALTRQAADLVEKAKAGQ